MTHFTFDSHWQEIAGLLKQRYGQLTDDDLTFAEGKGDELLGRLRQRLSLSADELDSVLDELHTQAGGKLGQAKARLGELADEARVKAGAVADDLKQRAASFGQDAKAQAEVAYDQARQQVGTWYEECEEYVRQKPRETLLAALCAGFVAGLLVRD